MDRAKFSAIAHTDHTICSPISEEKLERIIELLDLPLDSEVLDIGCGKAAVLSRVVKRWNARGVGVDPSIVINEAPEVPRMVLVNKPLSELPAKEYDLVLCIGADAAFGSIEETFAGAARYVKPGGLLLVGVGYWKYKPSPDYLQVLGGTEDELTTHLGNVMVAQQNGLTLLYSCTSNTDEWDHYEGMYLRGVETYVAGNPDDPDAAEMTKRIRDWHTTYLEWGRDTLGFGLYLLKK